ncbi:hypothetical protein ABTO37_19370, partial [Acinetobacter baumannii]
MLDSVQETIRRIQKTEENIDFSIIHEPNDQSASVQDIIQLKTSINNIYDAIENLSDKIENNSTQKRPMTQEDLI